MRVPIFQGAGKIEYVDRPTPGIDAKNTVLIQVEACGICGTDINILSVPPRHTAAPGIILGHEAVGRVVDLAKGLESPHTDVRVGDRVAIAPRLLCGNCYYCRMGLPNQCLSYSTVGTTRDGAFAPYVALPHTAVYKFSDNIPLDRTLFFEPLSCVLGAITSSPFRLGDKIVIFGAGSIGLLFALCYRAMGASEVRLIDIMQQRLDFASSLGIDGAINRTTCTGEFEDFCRSYQADIAVDAVGNQIQQCISILRRRGTALLFGIRPQDEISLRQYDITRYEYRIHGAFAGVHPFIQTQRVLESGVVDPAPLITHRYPLDALMDGVELMRRSEGMKVVIDMEQS